MNVVATNTTKFEAFAAYFCKPTTEENICDKNKERLRLTFDLKQPTLPVEKKAFLLQNCFHVGLTASKCVFKGTTTQKAGEH